MGTFKGGTPLTNDEVTAAAVGCEGSDECNACITYVASMDDGWSRTDAKARIIDCIGQLESDGTVASTAITTFTAIET